MMCNKMMNKVGMSVNESNFKRTITCASNGGCQDSWICFIYLQRILKFQQQFYFLLVILILNFNFIAKM